ncbi:MAG: hypothetical protein U9Q30_08535 [Campylobacterota bacterium]|nr:hypothetical protein [Campylobacterota bacterium]
MTIISFLLSLAILVIVFIIRKEIVTILNKKFNLKIESEIIVYIISIFFIIIIGVGMLTDGTKEKYSDIGAGIENLGPKDDENSRPHPMFDIDTYW